MCRLTDLLQQYRSAVQTVNKNQGDYEDQQQEMNSEEWQKSKQEMESIRQELDKIDRECMFGILAEYMQNLCLCYSSVLWIFLFIITIKLCVCLVGVSEIRPVKRGPPDAGETSDIIAKRTRSSD